MPHGTGEGITEHGKLTSANICGLDGGFHRDGKLESVISRLASQTILLEELKTII